MNMNMNMNFLSDNNNPSISDPPPPYTPSAASPTMQEPEPEQEQERDTKQPRPPSSPSEHTSSTLSPNRGIQIPSKHDYFTSGFAYPPFLANYDISPHHWTQFTHDLNEEVKLSPRQWATTVAQGMGVLALGGMMAGVLGAIPAVLVARKARRNREEMNLIVAASERPADTDSGFEGGSRLSRKVERWNETFFRPRGIVVRVDLPWEELDEMHGMEVIPTSRYGLSRRDEQAVREDASRKARIVIIPVDTDPSGSGSGSGSGSASNS